MTYQEIKEYLGFEIVLKTAPRISGDVYVWHEIHRADGTVEADEASENEVMMWGLITSLASPAKSRGRGDKI